MTLKIGLPPSASNSSPSALDHSLAYEPSLDGLRAVAIISVVLFHAYPFAVQGGWIGVDLFFVLSGFLITSLLDKEFSETRRIRLAGFYLQRFLRLAPPLIVVLATVLVFGLIRHGHRQELGVSLAAAATYTMNWCRAFGCPEGEVGHTWSLGIEEQFYLLWPLLLLAVRRFKVEGIILLLFGAILAWRCYLVWSGTPDYREYNGFDTRADSLLVGCAIAVFPKSRVYRWIAPYGWLAVAAFFCLSLLLRENAGPLLMGPGLSILALLGGAIVVASRQPGYLRTALSIPLMTFLGSISYEIYLWHWPLLEIVPWHLPAGIAVPATLAMTFTLAFATNRLVTSPMKRFRKRLARRARAPIALQVPAKEANKVV